MKLPGWLRGLFSGYRADSCEEPDAEFLLGTVEWIRSDRHWSGWDTLYCRAFAENTVAATHDEKIAQTFLKLRNSLGEEHRALDTKNHRRIACGLKYPHSGKMEDGPVFLSPDMDHKWDIFLYDGRLYFARSWTGNLVYSADLAFEPSTATVTSVTVSESMTEDPPEYAIRVVDYLIKSHIYGLQTPHPLPRSRANDSPQDLAVYSFAHFGCRGFYGTFEDTTAIKLIRVGDRYRLQPP